MLAMSKRPLMVEPKIGGGDKYKLLKRVLTPYQSELMTKCTPEVCTN